MQDSNWKRVSKEEHCPICGKPDWCTVTQDGMIACCMRVEAEKQAQNGGWIHSLDDTPKPFVLSYAPAIENKKKAEPKVLDKVYSAMLLRLPLSKGHKEELLSSTRGMTIEQINQNAYRSLPLQGRAQIARDLVQLFGQETMTDVPGFYLNDDGHGGYYPTLAGAKGLIIPIRDVQRRIIACQIKVDKKKELEQIGSAIVNLSKYTWFSSKGKEGGTSSGCPSHLAMPSSLIDKKRVWITEGALKADIACELLGEIVIGVSGVSNFRSGNVIPTLQQLDVEAFTGENAKPLDVVIAYDADGERNPHVKHHEFQLASLLSAKGYNVFKAQWELHKGKGIDDLLLNGEIPTITLWQTQKRIQKLDADFMEELFKAEKPVTIPLNEARQKHYQQIRELIEKNKKGVHAFTSVVGTGKTSAAMLAIKDLQQEGKWPNIKRKRQDKKTGKYYLKDEPLRVVFVTDNHAAYQQWLDDEVLKEIVEIQQGRSPDEKSRWYCERYNQCHQYGAARHNPMVDVCQECLLQHATLVGDRMVEDWKCPYLRSMDRVKAAKVVFTSKASIFNASRELKEFDLIIVDEDLFSSLWEIVSFNTYKLNDYLSGMDYIRSRTGGSFTADDHSDESIYPKDDDFRVFINLLKEVMATQVTAHNWIPAVPLMTKIAKNNNLDMKQLLDSLKRREVHYQTQRYDFEQPFSLHSRNIYPIRLMRDLIYMIESEIDRPQNADTRIWLTIEGIKLYIPRQHLVDIILRGKTVINLDATPNPLLQVIFPQTQFIQYDVEEHVTVTQLTNSLYTKSNLMARNYANIHKINVALEEITHNATFPVIFCHKAFDPQIESNMDNPNVFSVSNRHTRYGHFDYQTRAQNGYANADVLCIVGHYSHPISHLRAIAQAVRYSEDVVEKKNPMEESAHYQPLTEILRPYWHRRKDGCGLGRWCQSDPDPLVQTLIQHSEHAIYTQAIGRGRAALRSVDNPLRVYLITATPIDSLPIDNLVRLSDLSKKKPNRNKFYARRDELNARRKQTAYQKVERAIRKLLEAGKQITLNTIEKLSGVKRTVIAKIRKEIIEKLKKEKPAEHPDESVMLSDNNKSEIKMGILGGGGVTTVGLKINNTPQWTPPVTLAETTEGVNTNTKSCVSCDNLLVPQADDKPASGSDEPLTSAVDSDLAGWALKKHGFSFWKIIRAYQQGFELQEPLTIRDGVIVKDFCAFVGQKFAKIKDLDQRLPRLSGYVLEYANHLRVECIKDLKALNRSYSPGVAVSNFPENLIDT